MVLVRAKSGKEQKKWLGLLLCLLSLLPYQAKAQFYAATEEAYEAAKSDDKTIVIKKENRYWAFSSSSGAIRRDVGFIYHTGALYDERAYAPIMKRLAASGYPTFIIDEPLSVAWLAPFRADLVIRDHPEIKGWVVGGHGVGGSVAACYAQWRNVDGLALFSATPFSLPSPFSFLNTLQYSDIDAISLWGTLDGKTSRENWENSRDSMPANTLFEPIEGGNFSFMAYLKETVSGDNEAAIDISDQQAIVLHRLRTLMLTVQNKVSPPDTEDTDDQEDEDEEKSKSSDNSEHRMLRLGSI